MPKIPSDENKWIQPNNSDIFGNVYVTKNITFDEEGYLNLSYSPRSAIDESVDADFDNPAVILFSDDYGYYVQTWDNPWSVNVSPLFARPTEIATAGFPVGDPLCDAVWFGGLMVVSQDTDVDYYDPAGNTWTDTNISLTNNGQHPVENFLSLSAVAIADVNTVKLYSSPITATPTLIRTLTLPSDFEITKMVYHNQNMYITTQHVYGGHAFMFVWDGLGSSAGQAYEVDSNIIFSICTYQGTVALFAGNGSILRFNGSGFDLLAGFPMFYTEQALTDETNISLYKNILKANGDVLYILFSNQENDSNRLYDQPDGIWCYDPKVGLYRKFSLSNAMVQPETINTTAVNTTTNQITTTLDYATGTGVYYDNAGGTAIPELSEGTRYYVIRVDATHIKLATTNTLAQAGTAIDLTGTGNASQKLIFYPNIDFGQYWVNRVTALAVIERPTQERQYGIELLWGAEVSRRDSASNYGTLGTVADGVESRGYFITPKFTSDNVTGTTNLITLKFSPLTSDIDKIIIKYRQVDDMKKFINYANTDITWTATNIFTSTETQWADAVAGDEVEIVSGAGAGLLAHITDISEAGGTYTVTLDDYYYAYVSGDLARAVFRNWTKWKTIAYGDENAEQGFLSESLGAEGKMIQFKIELRGIRVRIEQFFVDIASKLPSSLSSGN